MRVSKNTPLVTLHVFLLLASTWRPAIAQEMLVPVNVQFPLMVKILSFNRAFTERQCKDLVIGILFQRRYRASFVTEKALLAAIQRNPITAGGLPIRTISVDVEDSEDWVNDRSLEKVDAIYVAPLRGENVERIVSFSRSKNVITFTGVQQYVEAGIAVGFAVRDEKPLIIINLPAAKAEGADLSSQLLKVAKVIN